MSLEDPEYLTELFSAFGRVSVRRMFGGAGVFRDGLMFALVADGELFLKADANTQPAFKAEGMQPFTYGKGTKRAVMSYWRMPERLLDEPDELAGWARDAFKAAQRAALKKPATRKSPAKKRK